jgi:hypothetical protein
VLAIAAGGAWGAGLALVLGTGGVVVTLARQPRPSTRPRVVVA